MLIDSLVVYGLHIWEKRLKEAKAKLLAEENENKEMHKKASHDIKVATRQEQKNMSKRVQHQGKAYPSTVPKGHIMQPDKMK
jgi:spore coat polysaccharide biosynthesis predicted glycosyltransferase SpsG